MLIINLSSALLNIEWLFSTLLSSLTLTDVKVSLYSSKYVKAII